MGTSIGEIISERKADDLTRRWIQRDIIAAGNGYKIVTREDWAGLIVVNTVALPTIFDELKVTHCGESIVAMCRIDKVWGAYVIACDTTEIADLQHPEIDFEYSGLETNEKFGSITLLKNGLRGLYSVGERQMALSPIYSEVTDQVACQYLWAKDTKGRFCFIDRESHEAVYPVCPTMVYDNDSVMLFECNNNRVYLANTSGLADKERLRKLVYDSGGRLTVVNTRYNIAKICDIYGYILE